MLDADRTELQSQGLTGGAADLPSAQKDPDGRVRGPSGAHQPLFTAAPPAEISLARGRAEPGSYPGA